MGWGTLCAVPRGRFPEKIDYDYEHEHEHEYEIGYLTVLAKRRT